MAFKNRDAENEGGKAQAGKGAAGTKSAAATTSAAVAAGATVPCTADGTAAPTTSASGAAAAGAAPEGSSGAPTKEPALKLLAQAVAGGLGQLVGNSVSVGVDLKTPQVGYQSYQLSHIETSS